MKEVLMDYDTQRDMLDLARRVQRECLRLGCSEPRTDPDAPPLPGLVGSYCDAHGDAL